MIETFTVSSALKGRGDVSEDGNGLLACSDKKSFGKRSGSKNHYADFRPV